MSALVRQPAGARPHIRHLRVLVLIANGHTNAEIGEQMYITKHTVDWYVAQLLARLGAHDRAHAVALGLKHGYITLDQIEPHPGLPLQEAS